jgi:AcrR family transcriptional regulator
MKRKSPVRRAKRVPLNTKITPSRAAGRSTFEDLLATAGELLTEVGFEGLSTNLICQRAGMTPPALYRYFPNKYAVLQELGRRLMKAQDDAVFAWMEAGGLEWKSVEEAVEESRQLQSQIIAITRKQPGSIWILRALRAVPILHQVRVESRDLVARRLHQELRSRYPMLSRKRLLAATRLSTELMSAAAEMALESPDQEPQITDEVSWMVALYYEALDQR